MLYCKMLQAKFGSLDRLTYEVEHFCPSLHGDALEDGEHGEQDVVKLGDAVVGSEPATSTHCAVRTQPGWKLCATRFFVHYLSWSKRETERENKVNLIRG